MIRVVVQKCVLVTLFAAVVWGQARPQSIYVESWRKGPGRISEQSLSLILDAKNPVYATGIKDAMWAGTLPAFY